MFKVFVIADRFDVCISFLPTHSIPCGNVTVTVRYENQFANLMLLFIALFKIGRTRVLFENILELLLRISCVDEKNNRVQNVFTRSEYRSNLIGKVCPDTFSAN
jgi:hypothetical protein